MCLDLLKNNISDSLSHNIDTAIMIQKWFVFFGVILLLTGCEQATEEIQDTPTSVFLIDDANIWTGQDDLLQEYALYNKQLLKDFDIDFRVVTTLSDEDINSFANQYFAQLQKTNRGKSGKSLLLVINVRQDKVRLEVSMALEPIYTDGFVSFIERKGVQPYLRDKKIADGIYMMTELVRDRAYEAKNNKEFIPPIPSKSIGAGATTKAYLGVKDPDAKKGADVRAIWGEKPQDVLDHYMDSLKRHNKNPNLDIYTTDTKEFLGKWTVTDINQNNEVRFLEQCTRGKETFIGSDDNHAVLLNIPLDEQRSCSPYFFKREEGKWKLDIFTMAHTLKFNVDMQWHFDMDERLNNEGMYYAFAFDGYGFDKNGFPFRPKNQSADWQKYRWGFTCGNWYYPNDRDKVKAEPQKYTKCWVKYLNYGMAANVRLGMRANDYIYAAGDGSERIEDISLDDFLDYMKQVPSGTIVTLEVLNKGRQITRRGVAP